MRARKGYSCEGSQEASIKVGNLREEVRKLEMEAFESAVEQEYV